MEYWSEMGEAVCDGAAISILQPLKQQPHRMVKHTQTIRRQFAWVCLTILWGWRLKG